MPQQAEFQSTRPRGARRELFLRQWRSRCHFNPRARVGRDFVFGGAVCVLPNFNPRARVGRDRIVAAAAADPLISTHAPAWGATDLRAGALELLAISIHAPAWGATRDKEDSATTLGFQSTRPRGARPLSRRLFPWTKKFQSTRPRGARRRSSSSVIKPRDFNPRARVGRDRQLHDCHLCGRISIHAPAWGATTPYCTPAQLFMISIHAPAWGATNANFPDKLSLRYFNPRARVGRDPPTNAPCGLRRNFNPRARVGRDCSKPQQPQGAYKFQSTRPRGARHTSFIGIMLFEVFQSTRPRGARRSL